MTSSRGDANSRISTDVAIKSARKSFPRLFQFLGGHFNQDWTVDARDPAEVIRRFVDDSDHETLAGVRSEMNRLLNQSRNEEELNRLMMELGCYIYFPAFATTAREWLGEARDSISHLAAAKRAGDGRRDI